MKLFLHISKEEQAERFQARLDDPTKNWKFNVADVDVRKRWDDYQVAYAEAISRTSTDAAPVVRRARPTASGTGTGWWPRSSSTCSRRWTRCSPNRRRASAR